MNMYIVHPFLAQVVGALIVLLGLYSFYRWLVAVHNMYFVKYDDAVSFYDAVSDTIRRRGGNRGIFTEEGVDTVAYFGGNHGSRV